MMSEVQEKKSFKLQLIEALGLKNILISNLVYRPPTTSYTFQQKSDIFNNKTLQFCLLKNKSKIVIKNPNIEIRPFMIYGKTSYCPALLLKSNKLKLSDSMIQVSMSPATKQTISSQAGSYEEPQKIIQNFGRTISHSYQDHSKIPMKDYYLLNKDKLQFQANQNDPSSKNFSLNQKVLVIFSHGNASDLGDVYFFGEGLVQNYDIDFLAYDYTGYGLGKGRFEISEKQIYDDLQNLISFATVELNYKLNQIILWGFSLGSGPTVELASRYSSIGGVVLQAPLASLILWIENQRDTITLGENDLYSNINKIQSIKSRILIIHGEKDQVINIRHSHLLFEKHQLSNNVMFLEVYNANHNNLQEIILQQNSDLGLKIAQFIGFVENQKNFMNSSYSEVIGYI